MKTLLRCVFFLSLVSGSAVAAEPVPAPLPAEQEQVLSEVRTIINALWASCERLDAVSATQDFLRAPGTMVVSSEGDCLDPDTLREGLMDFYARMASLKFTTIKQEFRILAPDLVLCVWSYRVDGVSLKNGPWFIDPETSSFLLRKQAGVWKCIFFQESGRPGTKLVSAAPVGK